MTIPLTSSHSNSLRSSNVCRFSEGSIISKETLLVSPVVYKKITNLGYSLPYYNHPFI